MTLKGQPTQVYNRGMGYLAETTQSFNRLPSGHPEGVYEAFGNIYKAWTGALLKLTNGEELTEADCDFPGIDSGIEGIKFIHACVESSKNDAAWVEL